MKKIKVAVVKFPGSNCDQDAFKALQSFADFDPFYLWHQDTDLQAARAVVLPGGFSYGDYLRCGALATYSPIMNSIITAAKNGLPVLGICNGFQILTEARLLPGVLMCNQSLKFINEVVALKVCSTQTPFTKLADTKQKYNFPIAHKEGQYFIDANGYECLRQNNQIIFEYVQNPNGSLHNIAGICNQERNVLGLMPHPERVCEQALGGIEGRMMFASLLESL